ncbi:MAG: FmdB family zinc ribbon protein [Candidatus Dormiibacterota bacterium]
MPTYGYHCPRCLTDFEVLQRMTDEPGADCPSCGARGRRLFYPTGIVFKGSGFYKTDSRKTSSGSEAGSSSSSSTAKQGSGKEAAGSTGEAGARPEKTSSSDSASGGSTAAATT